MGSEPTFIKSCSWCGRRLLWRLLPICLIWLCLSLWLCLRQFLWLCFWLVSGSAGMGRPVVAILCAVGAECILCLLH